jgi:hypothetical protein
LDRSDEKNRHFSTLSRFLYRRQTSRFFHRGGFSSSCRSSTLARPSVLSVHSQPALLCTRSVQGRWHRGQRLLARPCSPFHSAAVVGHGRRCCSRGLAAGRCTIAGSMEEQRWWAWHMSRQSVGGLIFDSGPV